MEEILISKAIIETYLRELSDSLELDVAIAGAGPAGMTSAYFLAKEGKRVAVFERQLKVGGGMPGGGMMFNIIVVQEGGKRILDEFGVRTREFGDGLYTANALETTSALCLGALRAGAKIFNLVSVEDVVIREEDKISGLVLNWSAVSWSKLHVDPLAVRAKVVIDATGHDSEVCRIVARKIGRRLRTPTGDVIGEKSMWSERGEREIVENTREIYPGLIVAGMAANAVSGSYRMGAIFGGMLISGKRASELALERLKAGC